MLVESENALTASSQGTLNPKEESSDWSLPPPLGRVEAAAKKAACINPTEPLLRYLDLLGMLNVGFRAAQKERGFVGAFSWWSTVKGLRTKL